MKKSKTPVELNKLAVFIVDQATNEEPDTEENPSEKNPHAVALGRLGGLKGGPARKNKLTKDQRIAIAQKAARSRWNKND